MLHDTYCGSRRICGTDNSVPGRAQVRDQIEANENIILHNNDAVMAHEPAQLDGFF